jgi:hypothetical protein
MDNYFEYKGYKIKMWGEFDGDFSDPINKHPIMYYMSTEDDEIVVSSKSISELKNKMEAAIDSIVGDNK